VRSVIANTTHFTDAAPASVSAAAQVSNVKPVVAMSSVSRTRRPATTSGSHTSARRDLDRAFPFCVAMW
jgi:hypothetical protein